MQRKKGRVKYYLEGKHQPLEENRWERGGALLGERRIITAHRGREEREQIQCQKGKRDISRGE